MFTRRTLLLVLRRRAGRGPDAASLRARGAGGRGAASVARRADVDARAGQADHQRRAARADREGAAAHGRAQDRRADADARAPRCVYFTGIRWGGGERLTACVIPAKGKPFFVCPAFEEDRAREQIALGPFGDARPTCATWNEDESPYERVAAGLKDRGIATGLLGIEETTKFVWSDSIAQAAPQLKIVSATPVVAGCRMIKERARDRR